MAMNFVGDRLKAQVRSIAFIIIYLLGFQILALGTAPSQALQIAVGIGLTVVGLGAFLEGLFLGLMPLGEEVGLRLPQRFGLAAIMAFGVLFGIGATYAEPATALLRSFGKEVTPWAAPLLYRLLESEPEKLVAAISVGVGLAVACGMLRFYRGISMKPFIFSIIPPLLVLTVICALDPQMKMILGLAWDSGSVTTGPVTVPLVLALGVGISRAIGKSEGAGDGFGVVMLASALPVFVVLATGFGLRFTTPMPVSESEFFAAGNREAALKLVGTEADLKQLAFERGSEEGRLALFGTREAHERAIQSLGERDTRLEFLGTAPLQDWFSRQASERERGMLPDAALGPQSELTTGARIKTVLGEEALLAFRAVVPLSAMLLLVLYAVLRGAPRYRDEVAFGITLTLVGMALLTGGIKLGLAPLGDQIGRPLPRVFRSVASEEGRIVLSPFDVRQVQTAYESDGTATRFFYLKDSGGTPRPVTFEPAQFDEESRRYEHIVKRPPLFGPQLTLAGVALVFLFAFGMGFGSTFAEPALRALGRTVEELSVGTISGMGVIRAVSIGVGLGLVMGVARILYLLPLPWLLLPPYLALFPLTYFSEEDFSAIAWDCGGVTTGPVTVPLVLAIGVGIGGELKMADGFGVLALTAVYPIISVLLYGMICRSRQRGDLVTGEVQNV